MDISKVTCIGRNVHCMDESFVPATAILPFHKGQATVLKDKLCENKSLIQQ